MQGLQLCWPAAVAGTTHRYVPAWLTLVLVAVGAVVGLGLAAAPLAAGLRRALRWLGSDDVRVYPKQVGLRASSAAIVDLDTATIEDLVALPGVGPVLAARIVDWRTAHGRFADPEELLSVPGIGTHRYRLLRSFLRVR